MLKKLLIAASLCCIPLAMIASSLPIPGIYASKKAEAPLKYQSKECAYIIVEERDPYLDLYDILRPRCPEGRYVIYGDLGCHHHCRDHHEHGHHHGHGHKHGGHHKHGCHD